MNKTYNVLVNSSKCQMKLDVEQIVFQSEKNLTPITLTSPIIDHVDWFILGSYATLHIYTTGNIFYAISDLQKSDQEHINKYLEENFSLGPESIKSHDVQIAGGNEGELVFHEKSFSLIKDGRVIINIPFSKIDQVQASSINELTIEFDTDEDLSGESLLSVRFYIPTSAEHDAKELRSELDQRTNSLAGTDNHIAEIRDVKFVKPKKKYNLRFCNDLLFMCNKEGNHKIQYSKISMIHRFLKPSTTDKRSEYILISLNKPIRQGQSSYRHLVIETSNSDPVISEGIEEKKPFIDSFEDLMSRVGNIEFSSTEGYYQNVAGEQGSSCAYKNQAGFLYMTQDAFVFLHSKIVFVPFKNVKHIEFEKLDKNKKFDLTITDKSNTSYTFTGIDTYSNVPFDEDAEVDREQLIKQYSYNGLESFYRFIRKHEIKIENRSELKEQLHEMKIAITTHDRTSKILANEAMRNIKDTDKKLGLPETDDDDEEEDEDFNPDAKGSDKDDDDDDDDEADGDEKEDEDDDDEKKGSDDEKDDSD